MAALYEEYARTPVLAKLADGRKLVPGSGLPDAPLMVVGEAPGEQEERRGRPFVGPCGTTLQELFSLAGIPWEYCYVTNVLPWRPPANRTPYPFEVQASQARLAAEVALVDPVVVVAAGDVAWRGLTRGELGRFDDASLRWHDLNGRRLVAVPHPGYLLRLKDPAELARWKSATVDALRLAIPEPAK
jgi:DNA polymerase